MKTRSTCRRGLCADLGFWAAILNVAGSVGYVLADAFRASLYSKYVFSNVLFIALAVVFVIDALLYLKLWDGAEPPPSRSALWGEYLNIAGSVGYLVVAVLTFHRTQTRSLLNFAMVGLNVVCVCTFVLDAIVYAVVWWKSRGSADRSEQPREAQPRGIASAMCATVAAVAALIHDVDLWGNALNIFASLLYLGGQVMALTILLEDDTAIERAVITASRGAIAGDLVWLVDSLVFAESWRREWASASPTQGEVDEATSSTPLTSVDKPRGNEIRKAIVAASASIA